jgi:hypothetical protein
MPASFTPINTPPALAETAPSGGEAQAGEASGRSPGVFDQVHLRAEGNGRQITVVLTGGERHEQIALKTVLDQRAIRRPGRGRPRLRPRRAAGDKAITVRPRGVGCAVATSGQIQRAFSETPRAGGGFFRCRAP